MKMSLIAAPTSEPISLTDAKKHLRLLEPDFDGELPIYIQAATSFAEAYTRRAYVEQTWAVTLTEFPDGQITLPLGKTTEIVSVAYIDADGVAQTLSGPEASPDGTDYQWYLGDDSGGILAPPVDGTWPDTQAGHLSPVTITFKAGYAHRADIPGQMLAGLLWKMTDLFELRGEVDLAMSKAFGSGPKSDMAAALLRPWRLAWF